MRSSLVVCAACAVGLSLGACATRSAAPVGVSLPPVGKRASASSAPAADAKGSEHAIPGDFQTSFVKLNKERYVSKGHAAGRYIVDIYGNSIGAYAYAKESGEVPVGARLIKEHFEKQAEAFERGPRMMMEKREKGFAPLHGDWEYTVLNSQGELVEKGAIASCAGCHDNAPHDRIFRVDP